MFRKSFFRACAVTSGGGAGSFADATFYDKVATLKKRFRGKGQYAHAKAAAEELFKAEVPSNSSELSSWLNESNATVALNGSQFFEISFPTLAEVCKYVLENMNNFSSQRNTLTAGVALCHHQNELTTDFKSYIKMDIIPPLMRKLDQIPTGEIDALCKLMQRCGCSEEKYWSQLCDELMQKRTDELQAMHPRMRESTCLRILSGTARYCPKHEINSVIIDEVLDSVSVMKSYDFASFVSAVQKLDDAVPQHPSVLRRLLRRTGSLSKQFTCRDLSLILKAIIKMKRETMSRVDAKEQSIIEIAYESAIDSIDQHVTKFVDKSSDRYWLTTSDVITVFFSLEASDAFMNSGSNQMVHFAQYISDHHNKLSAFETAVAAGVLRRTGCLRGPILVHLAKRAAQLHEDFSADEFAHVSATFLSRKQELSQHEELVAWFAKLESRAMELVTELHVGSVSRLYMCVAFPSNQLIRSEINFEEVAPRQLIDCLTMIPKAEKLWCQLVEILNAKYENDAVFSAIDVRRCSKMDFDGAIHEKAQSYIRRRLEEEHWKHDTLFLLPLLRNEEVRDGFLKKAIEQVTEIFVKGPPPKLQVATSLIVRVFSPRHLAVRDLVKAVGDTLVQKHSMHALVLWCNMCLKHPKELLPDVQWFDYFLFNPVSKRIHIMNAKNILTVLELMVALKIPGGEEKYREALGVMLERALEASGADDGLKAMLVIACKQIHPGQDIPSEVIEGLVLSRHIPNEMKEKLGKSCNASEQMAAAMKIQGQALDEPAVDPLADIVEEEETTSFGAEEGEAGKKASKGSKKAAAEKKKVEKSSPSSSSSKKAADKKKPSKGAPAKKEAPKKKAAAAAKKGSAAAGKKKKK